MNKAQSAMDIEFKKGKEKRRSKERDGGKGISHFSYPILNKTIKNLNLIQATGIMGRI